MPQEKGQATERRSPSPRRQRAAPASPADGQAEAAAPVDPQASFWRWGRIAAILLAFFLGWQLFLVARGLVLAVLNIVLYVVFGAVLAYIGSPLARLLERRLRFPRTLASLCALLTEILVLGLLVWLITGPLIAEGRGLARALPGLITRGENTFNQVQHALAQHGINIGSASSILSDLPARITPVLTGIIFTAITQSINVILDVVVVLVTGFWLIRDGTELRRGAVDLIPGRARSEVEFALDATAVVVGGYVRGQLLMAALIGFLAWLGCTIIGVPYPIVVGVAAGLFELIPLVGPFVGGAVGTLLALTSGPVLALETVGVFLVIHLLEGYVIAPRVQAHFVQLHPLLAFLALIAGIEVNGFLGALFAVPVASLGAVLVRAYIGDARARHPDLFRAAPDEAAVEGRHRRMLRSFRILTPAQRGMFRRAARGVRERLSGPSEPAAAEHHAQPQPDHGPQGPQVSGRDT